MENNLPNIEEIKVFLQNNNYQYQRFLGKGDYSVVVQAYSYEYQIDVAVKIFNEEDQDIEKEIQILEKLQGENYFVQIISTIIDTDMNLYAVVTELYDCDLKMILSLNKFSFKQILALTQQLLKALLVLQTNGVIHSDVKPQNILFSRTKNMFALCDFGKAHSLKDPLLEHTNSSLAGNLIYMSPEVSNGVKPYTLKADVFSIGIVILQCMLGAQLKPEQIIFLKASLLVNVIPDIQSHPNYEFIDKIISYMVNFNKDQRLEPLRLIQKLKSFQKVDESCLNQLVLPKKQEFSQTNLKKSAFQQKQTNQNDQKQCNFQNIDHIQYQQEQQLPILYKNYFLQNLNYLNSVLPQNGNSRRIIKIQKITTITPLYQDFVQQNYFNGQIYYMPPQHNTPQYQEYSKPPFSKYPRNQNN